MFAKKSRIPAAVIGLALGTASWLGAGAGQISPASPASLHPAAPPFSPALPFEASHRSAGGGNCDSDADCPGGYCYHDPIALVPYCVAGSVSLEPGT